MIVINISLKCHKNTSCAHSPDGFISLGRFQVKYIRDPLAFLFFKKYILNIASFDFMNDSI